MHEENKLDMAWGHPAFLFPYWKKSLKPFRLKTKPEMEYIYGSIEDLKSIIRVMNLLHMNANATDCHVVVGNGASQVITAAIHALGKPVWANAPYFSRFPLFADYAGVSWDAGKEYTQIITWPNNPDGNTFDKQYANNTIFDLSYNWNQYIPQFYHDQDIMVFSLSKATGHASTRVGWALVKDAEIAKKMTDYIETTTGGVSIEAQREAFAILHSQVAKKHTVFKFGRKVLEKRWQTIDRLRDRAPFEILNHEGMFLYCEGKCPDNILSINGTHFGDSSNRFRLNIGCDSKTFHEFTKIIACKS